jgi:hypothetical protein
MTTTDWLIDIALLAIVLKQLRGDRIDARFILLPLGLCSYFAYSNLKSIPTAGNDLHLSLIFAGIGITLGVLGGFATRVHLKNGAIMAKAGLTAAFLWVLGMGFRMGFQIWSTHGGASTLTRFSVNHDITTVQAWVAALVLMAVCEVVFRMAIILVRSQVIRARSASAPRLVADRAAEDLYV